MSVKAVVPESNLSSLLRRDFAPTFVRLTNPPDPLIDILEHFKKGFDFAEIFVFSEVQMSKTNLL